MTLHFLNRFRKLDVESGSGSQNVRLLNWITLAIALIAALHAFFTILVIHRLELAVYSICASILAAALNLAVRRGYGRNASFLFIAALWVLVTIPSLLPDGNGIFGVAFSAYIIPILLAGLLLDARSSYAVVILSIAVGVIFAIKALNTPQLTLSFLPTDVLLKLTSEAIFFIVAANLLALANRNTSAALKSANSSEQELRLRNVELERQIAERQQIESVLRQTEATSQQFQERLKALHEISIRLSSVSSLEDLYKQAIILSQSELGFDRMGWFVIDPLTKQIHGTYGIDTQGKLRNEHDLAIHFSVKQWAETLERFTDKGYVRFLRDAPLWDNEQQVGQGWNAIAAVSYGEHVLGWLAADNLLHQAPLQDYQLEIMRLYGSLLGQLVVQKQTQQMLVDKDTRLNLALEAANMRSWDWGIQTNVVASEDLYKQSGLTISTSFEGFLADIHPDDQAAVLDAAQLMVDKTGTFEAEYRTLDAETGAVHWLYSLGQPYRDVNGEIAGVAGVVQDITGRKQIEESLKRADQQAMELALERERVSALSEFIHTISHDFKTPLAIINNSLYLLERIDDPKKHKEKLALIKTQTLLLDKQIQDILTISRLQYTPVIARHPVNMNLLVNKLDELFHASLEKKNLAMVLDLQPVLPNILANADELDRVFVNLLENAINYTPAGGTITLSTHSTTDTVEFSIADTGIGMTPEDRHKVFNNFYRGENARMINSKGTGLGLAIVHKIVTIHQGRIEIESELNQGTRFRLYFPIHTAPK